MHKVKSLIQQARPFRRFISPFSISPAQPRLLPVALPLIAGGGGAKLWPGQHRGDGFAQHRGRAGTQPRSSQSGSGRPLPPAAHGTSRSSHTAGKLFLRPGPRWRNGASAVAARRAEAARPGVRRCQAAAGSSAAVRRGAGARPEGSEGRLCSVEELAIWAQGRASLARVVAPRGDLGNAGVEPEGLFKAREEGDRGCFFPRHSYPGRRAEEGITTAIIRVIRNKK